MIGSSKIGLRPIRGGGGGAAPNPDFVSTWDTTKAGSASDTVVLPLLSGGTYSGTIDWGDGSQSVLNYANRTHVYSSSGIYTVTLSGTIGGFAFGNSGDKAKITDISNWGTLDLTNSNAFWGCSNMDVSATDSPIISTSSLNYTFYLTGLTDVDLSGWDVSGVTSMEVMFGGCSNFNSNLSSWDVSSVTSMRAMFQSASSFSGNIDDWDVSSVKNMGDMFRSSTFNTSINSWDVSNVTNMNSMFLSNSAFDQPLNLWDVSSVTDMNAMFRSSTFNQDISSWAVTSLTNVSSMFRNNAGFNQPIGAWDTSSILNFGYMFLSNSAFDQDISNWSVSQATSLISAFRTMSTANYDALLIAWDAQGAMSYSGTVNFGASQYTSGGAAEAARTSLITKWGGITDGGAA